MECKSGTLESVELMLLDNRFRDIYCGSTVLVTGHTGFKGGWLSVWLALLGARVIGYSQEPPTTPSFYQSVGLKEHITDIRGDILDFKHLSNVVHKYKPDFIFHLAAQPLVRASYKIPSDTFNVNVMGTVNVLESIRLAKKFTVCICITSDKCYENKEWDYAYRENDPMGGYDPYSASKGAAELVISSYRKSFFNLGNEPLCALSSARAGNIIGGGDWADDRLVPDCIRSIVKGDSIRIRNPHAIRPWQFVLDPLSGYLMLATKMKEDPEKFSGAWNFGPYYLNNVDVQTVVNKVIEAWGKGKVITQLPDDSLHEAGFLQLDIAKSITKLKWSPKYSLQDSIKKTVEWYKQYYSNSSDMNSFTKAQILDFPTK